MQIVISKTEILEQIADCPKGSRDYHRLVVIWPEGEQYMSFRCEICALQFDAEVILGKMHQVGSDQWERLPIDFL